MYIQCDSHTACFMKSCRLQLHTTQTPVLYRRLMRTYMPHEALGEEGRVRMTHTSMITPLPLPQSHTHTDEGHIIWMLPTSSPHPGKPPISVAAGGFGWLQFVWGDGNSPLKTLWLKINKVHAKMWKVSSGEIYLFGSGFRTTSPRTPFLPAKTISLKVLSIFVLPRSINMLQVIFPPVLHLFHHLPFLIKLCKPVLHCTEHCPLEVLLVQHTAVVL